MNKPRVTAEVLPLKERKILGAESDSLEEVSAPDDRATQASSPHTAAHNILLLLVIRRRGGGGGGPGVDRRRVSNDRRRKSAVSLQHRQEVRVKVSHCSSSSSSSSSVSRSKTVNSALTCLFLNIHHQTLSLCFTVNGPAPVGRRTDGATAGTADHSFTTEQLEKAPDLTTVLT